MTEPIDVVYTWVDDRFPGYLESRELFAATLHDRNPNRTRDNLDLLKYSLRSLCTFLPWVGRVHLVCAPPQIPHWLAPEAPLTLIHHDAILDPAVLPTFNSFAIVSALHRIPGLSRRFLYIEDDMLFGRAVTSSDFLDDDERLRLYPRIGHTSPAEHRDRDGDGPWNASVAQANFLLDGAFDPVRRRPVGRMPLLIDKDYWAEMLARWPEDFARTQASRFRARHNVPPEYLYPYYLLYTERGRLEPLTRTYRTSYYRSLDNIRPKAWADLAGLHYWRTKFVTLNDGFGAHPDPTVVAAARRMLDALYPVRSPFEAPASLPQ